MSKIKKHIDYGIMKTFMNAPIDDFQVFGEVTQTPDGIYIHKDRGSNILAVAHLDSVNPYDHFYVNNFAGVDHVFSTRLDDRLGAYIILSLLPELGISTDVLLTEGEEIGKSTAKHFRTDKQYKWMFSFDRRGDGAVHYRYNRAEWLAILKKHFGSVLHGSVSDIDYLSHLGCCGVNVGTGYHEEHHLMAHANMAETASQVGKFMQFYQTHKRDAYPYVSPPPPVYTPAPYTLAPTTKEYPKSEEKEEDDEWDWRDSEYNYRKALPENHHYNPYDGLYVEVPFDILEYAHKETGVITPPDKCAFCVRDLATITASDVFMGICFECERWAVQCYLCESYFCRKDEPNEDMGEEMFFGICPVCEENWRHHDTDTGFSRDFKGTLREDVDSPGGDEDNTEPGFTGPKPGST